MAQQQDQIKEQSRPADLDTERASEIQFLQEKIKERPVNKKKLLRRTIITIALAVVFGMVACITFSFLEPVISGMLYPDEEPQVITFPEEEEEISPEDMVADDEELQIIRQENAEQLGTAENTENTIDTENVSPNEMLSDFTGEVALKYYDSIYRELDVLRTEAEKSLVTITSVDKDGSWIDDSLKNVGETSGVVIADNGIELLVLADSANIADAETITISFKNGESEEATIKGIDKNTGLSVLAIPISEMSETLKKTICYAELGSSLGKSAVGKPVIAIGSPIGKKESVCYGIVTSQGTSLSMLDSNYKMITTDIYGSKNASGVLLNLKGQIIGVIHNEIASSEMPNQLCAIGISELKKMIERLSNNKGMFYLGIQGMEINNAIRTQYNMPIGAYVSGIEMGSPAMEAGIQSGDIIVKVDDMGVTTHSDFINYLMQSEVGQTITLTIARQGQTDYQEMTLEVTLGEQ